MSTRQYPFYAALEGLNISLESFPYTKQQFDACQAAWCRLVEESCDEQALAVLKILFPQAKTKTDCWDWLTAELRFEAYAFALDDRAQAAVHFLQFGPGVTDEMLDRYTQRLQRFYD